MTKKQVVWAFEAELKVLPLAALLPIKRVTDAMKSSPKYGAIARSIDEIGVIEPLVVYRKPDRHGRHLLLDGHLKRTILLDKGETEAECLLATDDEAYTYNKRVIRLGIVQEHFMILRAIERGVSEERIARALNVKVENVRRRRTILRGICDEAVKQLRDKPINPAVFDKLRKMKPSRQVEASALMASASNYTSAYAKALLAATDDADLVRPMRPNAPRTMTSADLALMDRELREARKKLEAVEASYGRDMLDLVVAARYVSRLLSSQKIARYLDDNHPEITAEFRSIVSAVLPRVSDWVTPTKKTSVGDGAVAG